MSIAFSGKELIDIAIGIERSGITFYDVMARSTDDATARDIFQRLADMERQHILIFQQILDEDGNYGLEETSTGEYPEYLRALIDNAVFTGDMITSEMAARADSDLAAVELGIRAEKDSILFYYELKDILPRTAVPVVDRIIAEEKSHLHQLSEVRKILGTRS